jgi:hypothetical protein
MKVNLHLANIPYKLKFIVLLAKQHAQTKQRIEHPGNLKQVNSK